MRFNIKSDGSWSKTEVAAVAVFAILSGWLLSLLMVAWLSWIAMLILGALGYTDWGFWQTYGAGVLLYLAGLLLNRAASL